MESKTLTGTFSISSPLFLFSSTLVYFYIEYLIFQALLEVSLFFKKRGATAPLNGKF